MACNLANAFKLTFRVSKYIFQSHRHIPRNSFSILSLQKFKYNSVIDISKSLPATNFHTCNIQYSDKEKEEKPEETSSSDFVTLTFITAQGEAKVVKGEVGSNVMLAAVKNGVPMEGACDGQLACTTCHVYVDKEFKQCFEEPDTLEEDLLDNAPFIQPNSRLSCQLKITKKLDNARFHLPLATTNFYVDKKKNQS